MGRNRAFGPDQVLTAAMHRFRKHGYEGTSEKDLEQETGLTSGSLNDIFGGKRATFAAAVDHYNTTVVKRRIGRFLGDEAVATDAMGGLWLEPVAV